MLNRALPKPLYTISTYTHHLRLEVNYGFYWQCGDTKEVWTNDSFYHPLCTVIFVIKTITRVESKAKRKNLSNLFFFFNNGDLRGGSAMTNESGFFYKRRKWVIGTERMTSKRPFPHRAPPPQPLIKAFLPAELIYCLIFRKGFLTMPVYWMLYRRSSLFCHLKC